MRSIARTLTFSLSVAAALIFTLVLGIVVCIDGAQDPSADRCKALLGILSRSLIMGADGTSTLQPTRELQSLQEGSPALWYAIASGAGLEEYRPEHRPPWAADLLLKGLTHWQAPDADHPGKAVCLQAQRIGGSDVVLMGSGASLTVMQLIAAYLWRNLAVLLLVAGAFAITVAAGVVLSARFVARSIERVTAMALAVDPVSPQGSIPLADVPFELVPLVTALNRAFDQIDIQMSRQRRFLGNAAHELRTPLTLLRTKMEDVTPRALRSELVRDARHLSSLVSTMLDLARLQERPMPRDAVNLVTLARAVLADFAPTALNNGIELSLEHVEPVMVEGVETALRSALANLVSNALSHAKGASRIVAEVADHQITVSDDGVGVVGTNIETMVRPFEKGNPADAGAGLGLAIVQEIMLAHGGRLEVQSHTGMGMVARMTFPPLRPEGGHDLEPRPDGRRVEPCQDTPVADTVRGPEVRVRPTP